MGRRRTTCFKCDTPLDGAHRTYCKSCAAAYQRERRQSDLGADRAYRRGWYAANPEKAKRYRRQNMLRMNYGMELADYQAMHEAQDGRCAICDVKEAEAPKGRLFVDHDHETDEVRGLVCSNCNLAIGLFDDNVKRIEQAIRYIRYHERKRLRVVSDDEAGGPR